MPTARVEDKPELLALNKIDALTPEAREAKADALEAVAGVRPKLVSGVSGEGVTELLRAAWREVRVRRGEIEADDAEQDYAEPASAEGWRP